MEIKLKKNTCMYTCITEPLCYIPEADTTLQINYTSIKMKIINKQLKGINKGQPTKIFEGSRNSLGFIIIVMGS